MKRSLRKWLVILLLALTVPAVSFAQSLEEAARQAARQYDAKVLSARTIQQGNNRVHEIKLLTRKGVVKTVRVTDRRKKKPG